jgi:membrane-associated phospholipid phosphatase
MRSATGILRRPFTLLFCSALFTLSLGRAFGEGIPIDTVNDPILLAAGFGTAGISELIIRYVPPIEVLSAPDQLLINPVDLGTMFPYSFQTDIASSVLQYSAAAIPLIMSASSGNMQKTITDSMVYAESLALAYGSKNILKYLFPRYRPYVYEGGAPGITQSEDDESFPSGHSTMAFTAAAFAIYLYTQSLPGSANEWPFLVADYGLASLTAAYRVLSGMHFLTDVLAGAVIGTFCGFIIPSIVRR